MIGKTLIILLRDTTIPSADLREWQCFESVALKLVSSTDLSNSSLKVRVKYKREIIRDFVLFKLQVFRERNLDLNLKSEEVRWVFAFVILRVNACNNYLTYLTLIIILSNDLHQFLV